MLKDINPIKLVCLKQGLNRTEFAVKLGYEHIHNYSHHEKNVTPDILKRVKDVFGVDLSNDVIAYLKRQLRIASGKRQTKARVKATTERSILSLVTRGAEDERA